MKLGLRQVFFKIKFVLYLPEWASGDKNLCSTLNSCFQGKGHSGKSQSLLLCSWARHFILIA